MESEDVAYTRAGFFSLRHFGHWNISVICFTIVLKLAVTVFIGLYSDILTEITWFFSIISVYNRKKTAHE